MDLSQHTEDELFVLRNSSYINEEIKILVDIECKRRNIKLHIRDDIYKPYDPKVDNIKEPELELENIFLLILFPFFVFMSDRIRVKISYDGDKIKLKKYWLFISIGFLIWTVLIVLMVNYYFFTEMPSY